jgi:ribosome-binding protein aMBF1 (putative translation factor)
MSTLAFHTSIRYRAPHAMASVEGERVVEVDEQTPDGGWGPFIRTCRKDRGWTQEELARVMGVRVQIISRWECGENVPLPVFRRLLRQTFGVVFRARRTEG